MKYLNLTIFLAISFFSFGQEQKLETFKAAKFSIQYPLDWEVNDTGLMGSKLFLLSPLSSPNDAFRENINVIVEDIRAYNLDLDGYIKASEQQLMQIMPDAKFILSERMSTQNPPFHKIVYTGSQSNFELKFLQYIWAIDGTATILTFTAEVDQFDSFIETAEEVLNSFRFE